MFVRAQTQEKFKYLAIDRYLKHSVLLPFHHTSLIMRSDGLLIHTTGIDLKRVILSEKSQSQMVTDHMSPFRFHLYKIPEVTQL